MRGRWADAAPVEYSLQGFGRAFENNFDAAIFEIFRVPGNAVLDRNALARFAEDDALHAAGHQSFAADNGSAHIVNDSMRNG